MRVLIGRAVICAALWAGSAAMAQPAPHQSQPTEASRKLPPGSAEERRARMAKRAAEPAYAPRFDLSALPAYVPKKVEGGEVRVCGNNYLGDAPLGGWWKETFERAQPDIKILYNLPSAAIAIPCLYFGLADIGVNHEPSFYDYLSHLRVKGYAPLGISVFTGSYNLVGWQNNLVIIVNKANPISQISVRQLDGIFGSLRDGGWRGTVWHPEFARGAKDDIRDWGQMGLTGPWKHARIGVYGYSLRYATALEFSNKVLQASDKWNGDLHAFANYPRPDGTTYLEADQVIDHVKADPHGIGYVRFHDGVPGEVKILAVAKDDRGPYVPYSIDSLQNRSYPLWGDQSFWISLKKGEKIDGKLAEFIRFVLSREGQELVQKDGKYLPLTADLARAQWRKLDCAERGDEACLSYADE